MEEDRVKNIIIKVLVVIMVLLLLVVTGIFIYREFFKENKNTEPKIENKDKTYESKSILFDCDFENETECSKKYMDKEIVTSIDSSNNLASIKIGEKVLLTNLNSPIKEVHFIDGNAIFLTSEKHLYIFNLDGSKIFDTTIIDSNYPNSMKIKNLEMQNNFLILEGSRVVDESNIMMEDGTHESVCNVKVDEQITGEYKIDYLGSNKFSKIKATKYITLDKSDISVKSCAIK